MPPLLFRSVKHESLRVRGGGEVRGGGSRVRRRLAKPAAPDPVTSQPALKVQLIAGGLPEVLWKKGQFDGIRLQIDRGDGKGWVELAIDMKPNFTDDLSPLPAAGKTALWQYRAIYLLNDADFGQWSAPVSVTVAG